MAANPSVTEKIMIDTIAPDTVRMDFLAPRLKEGTGFSKVSKFFNILDMINRTLWSISSRELVGRYFWK